MTIKTRRVLFYGLFLLFIVTSLIAVSYSFGWRISAENCFPPDGRQSIFELTNCFQKTGGLFIETEPKGVIIKIDEKIFKDKSGLIQNGTLIDNLLPKNYKIRIEKEGYLPYEKNARVESNLVAKISNTVLIPEKIEKTPIPISKPIDNFWISSQQEIVFENNGTLYYNLSKLKGDKFVNFSEDGKKIIVENSKNEIYYLYELNDLSKTINLNAVLNNLNKNAAITEIVFNPADSNKLIISAKKENGNNYLYLLNLNRLTLEIITKEPIFSWTVKNPNIYYIRSVIRDQQPKTNNKLQTTDEYILASFNLILKTETAISAPLDSQYLIPNFQLILSPDNKKIAFFNESGEINIYFPEDYQSGISKKAGDIIGLDVYKNKKIKNVFWHKDSYHLFVATEKNIDFIEIDDRTPINKYTLIENVANFYYDPKLNKLYFIQKNKAYSVEFK